MTRHLEAQAGDLYTQIVAKCYTAYQKELRQSEAVDFDDLIMLTLRLFDQKSRGPDLLPAEIPVYPCR